jgi:hypothetical protein
MKTKITVDSNVLDSFNNNWEEIKIKAKKKSKKQRILNINKSKNNNMKETTFNPTEENKIDLDSSINNLKARKSGLVFKKIKAQNEIAILKEILLNPTKNVEDYNEATHERGVLKEFLRGLEDGINTTNLEIKNKQRLALAINSHLNANSDSSKEKSKLLKGILVLKDKYSTFSSDPTRVSSMRVMASIFNQEMEDLINKHK